MGLIKYIIQKKINLQNTYRRHGVRGIQDSIGAHIDFFTRLPTSLTRPHTFHIQIISGICNLSCKICPPPPPNKGKEISFEQFKKIFDRCGPIDELRLSAYGEPFLVKDIFTIIEYAKASGCRVGTTTNMMLIDAAMAQKLIKAQFDTLDISFDGATKETFEDIRTGARFETIIDNIKTLNRIKKERGSKKPELGLSVTAMKRNMSELGRIVELAAELEIPRVNINALRVTNKAPLAVDTQTLRDIPEVSKENIELARQKAKNLGVRLRITLSYPNDGCNALDSLNGIKGCKQPWQLTTVRIDGAVGPCCRSPIKIGNIFQTPIITLWNNKKFRMIRKIVRKEGFCCNHCFETLNSAARANRIFQ